MQTAENMIGTNLKVLVIDDDEDDLYLTCDYLKSIDTFKVDIETEINYKKACEKVCENKHDIYIVDYLLGPHTGVELIAHGVKCGVNKPYILLTGKGDKEIDINATKAGAYDYLIKGEINTEMLERSLRYSSERYRAYKDVAENEKRYRDIFDKTTDIIFVLNNDLHFINFNTAMNSLLGYDETDLINHSITELFPSNDMGAKFIQKVKNNDAFSNEEIVLLTKLGEEKTFLASCTRIATENDGIQYQGILFDYTTIKKSVADELLKERVEATNRLVRTLAHEIRNPLTNINLSVEQLEDDINDDQKYLTSIVKRNSKRINDLISELMNISKPEENKLARIEVKQVLQETVLRALDRIELKRIKIEKHFLDEEIFIDADSEKIQIALLNILINAVEAVEEGKGFLSIDVKKLPKTILISITDNGSGISDDHLSKLFQPYFTGKKNGMGLGLAATHSIVKSHRGDVQVQSTLGKGTTFNVFLPYAVTQTVKHSDTVS